MLFFSHITLLAMFRDFSSNIFILFTWSFYYHFKAPMLWNHNAVIDMKLKFFCIHLFIQ